MSGPGVVVPQTCLQTSEWVCGGLTSAVATLYVREVSVGLQWISKSEAPAPLSTALWADLWYFSTRHDLKFGERLCSKHRLNRNQCSGRDSSTHGCDINCKSSSSAKEKPCGSVYHAEAAALRPSEEMCVFLFLTSLHFVCFGFCQRIRDSNQK